jgi:ABC-type sugar transport system ATPase subunit
VTTPVIALHGVAKRFGAVDALRGVDLSVDPGTVHALVGENGAGKSTLGKIISGAIRPDCGEVLVAGRPVQHRSPADALRDGIAVMQQELGVVPDLSVEANVFLGDESVARGLLSQRVTRARFRALLERTGFDLDPEARAGSLRLADRQVLEILRAVNRGARLIVMDEPTSALPEADAAKLHDTIRGLCEAGVTIVYISHFLDEVLRVADRVTVMRNGEDVVTTRAAETDPDRLIAAMLGQEADLALPPKQLAPASESPVLSVRGLSSPQGLSDISFDVHPGEIVGVGGLVGSGRSELLHAVYGSDRAHGEVLLGGVPYAPRSPRASIERGMSLLAESRSEQGLFHELEALANATAPYLNSMSRAGVIRRGPERSGGHAALRRAGIGAESWGTRVKALSGGNQQRVLFARSVLARPGVLLLDEPTRGVDVGAKLGLYQLITALARDGVAVLFVSSELEELIGLSHRVLVMRLGRLVAELSAREVTSERVMAAAFGHAVATGAKP